MLHVGLPGSGAPLRVCLLDEEPAGVIATRAAGAVALEATLEWPPECGVEASVIDSLPASGSGLRSSLRETAGEGHTTLSGELRCFDEEALRAAVEETLRVLASTAAAREAALRTRLLRTCRVRFASSAAVQPLARLLWASGVRVGFAASWSPATPEADLAVGCGGDRERLVGALAASRVDRVGAAG